MPTLSEQWAGLVAEYDQAWKQYVEAMNGVIGLFAEKKNPPDQTLQDAEKLKEKVDDIRERMDEFCEENT